MADFYGYSESDLRIDDVVVHQPPLPWAPGGYAASLGYARLEIRKDSKWDHIVCCLYLDQAATCHPRYTDWEVLWTQEFQVGEYIPSPIDAGRAALGEDVTELKAEIASLRAVAQEALDLLEEHEPVWYTRGLYKRLRAALGEEAADAE